MVNIFVNKCSGTKLTTDLRKVINIKHFVYQTYSVLVPPVYQQLPKRLPTEVAIATNTFWRESHKEWSDAVVYTVCNSLVSMGWMRWYFS